MTDFIFKASIETLANNADLVHGVLMCSVRWGTGLFVWDIIASRALFGKYLQMKGLHFDNWDIYAIWDRKWDICTELFSSSQGTGEPALLRRLARAFAARYKYVCRSRPGLNFSYISMEAYLTQRLFRIYAKSTNISCAGPEYVPHALTISRA